MFDTPTNLSVTNITADYSANTNGYSNPLGSNFEVSYNWYAVLEGGTANPINLGTAVNNYNISITDPGTYTFYVEVKYVVKTDDGTRSYIAGHKDLRTTMGYIHTSTERMHDAVAKLPSLSNS